MLCRNCIETYGYATTVFGGFGLIGKTGMQTVEFCGENIRKLTIMSDFWSSKSKV
ncbi:MAG: hypothetical protein RLZZ262_2474 [Bacteroidota bacterium]|jgi:hypothetical protein